MKRNKYILTSVLTLLILSAMVLPVLAAAVTKTITVETDVKVYVNDKGIDVGDTHGNPDAFIYNGTTYIAAKAVSNSLGQNVAWDGNTRSVYIGAHKGSGEAAQSGNKALSFSSDSITKDITVTEYHLKEEWGFRYAFLVIENHSDYDLNISAEVKLYNKNGELVGAERREQEAVGKKTKTIMYFMPDEEYETIKYELTTKKETYYDCVTGALTYESVSAKNKEIFSVKNNGDVAVKFAEGYALFFNKGKTVGFASTYFVDDDSELKPGKTITRELDCYVEYDSVKFYLTGRANK